MKFVSGSDVQRETRIVLAAVFPHFIGTYKSNGIFNTCGNRIGGYRSFRALKHNFSSGISLQNLPTNSESCHLPF